MAMEGIPAHRRLYSHVSNQDFEMLNKAQIKGETQGIAVKSEELQLEDISLNTPQQVAVKPEPSTPLPNVVIKCEPNPQPRAPGRYEASNSRTQKQQHISHILASRRMLQREDHPSTGAENFSIKGVTYEGRQEPLEELAFSGRGTDEPLILVHEGWKEEKPAQMGIAIRLLDGRSLGWVPNKISSMSAFKDRHEQFAKLDSLEYISSGAHTWLGANVSFSHWLEPLIAPAFPAQLQDLCQNLEQYMSEEAWHRISEQAKEQAHNRCQISGVEGQPLTVVPIWKPNTMLQSMTLQGFMVIAEILKEAQLNLLRDGSARQAEAITLFAEINGWAEYEVSDYIQYKKRCIESAEREDWSIDLGFKFRGVLGLRYNSFNHRYEPL